MFDRDLIGYAGKPPDIIWPNGARVAVSVVVNFEEGAEHQIGDGDRTSERVGEVLSVVPEGRRDQGQEQIFAYGSRVGLWRFLRALQDTQTPATFYMCGRAVERSPQLARAVVEGGHEAACHGWTWRPHADFPDAKTENAALERATKAIEKATGQRPLGFFCRGSESDWTRTLLSKAGYVYTSNLDTNDMKFFHPNGFTRSSEMVEYVKDAVQQLLTEAACGKSSTISIGFHLRITGRPARFRAVTEILEYLASLEGQIWRARRIDIARYFAAGTPRGQTTPQQGETT